MVVRTAITPAYGDAAIPGVLDGIEDQVLGNTTNLDRIAVGGEPRRSFTAQKQPMMLRQRANALAELLEYRRDVDRSIWRCSRRLPAAQDSSRHRADDANVVTFRIRYVRNRPGCPRAALHARAPPWHLPRRRDCRADHVRLPPEVGALLSNSWMSDRALSRSLTCPAASCC